jgi:hypothetical protein
MVEGDLNLLEELIARSQQPAAAYDAGTYNSATGVPGGDVDLAGGIKLTPAGQSLLEKLTGKKVGKPSPFPNLPVSPASDPYNPATSDQAPPPPIPWGDKAGIIAPGIGGLGNLNASTTRAPVGPVDPNYVPETLEADKSNPDLTSGIPTPRPGPVREADGSPSQVDPATDVSSRGRGPAAEQEASRAPRGALPPGSAVPGAIGLTSVGGPAGPVPVVPPGTVAPAQPAPQSVAAAPAGPQMANPSLWDNVGAFGNRIMKGLSDHSNTLLAIGAGFAGAPNIGQGISRASQYAIPATQQDLKNRISTGSQSATYQALREAGVPQQQAIAAIGNPELQKRLLDAYIGDRKSEIKTIKSKDAFGNETERLVAINPYDNTSKEITGQPSGAAGGISPGGMNSGAFAPGVTAETFNHNAVGDDYIKQFSPEVQQAAKDYLAGRTSQTGRQLPQQMIKMAAQKYGGDIGMPADDASVGQRKQWSNSLGDIKSGVGLSVKGFQQGLEHAAALSDSLVKLGNTNGMGLEPVANWVNSVKNLTSEQTAIKNQIQAKSQALAGEIGKLYSGSNGGGVHERAQTQQNLGKVDSSPIAASGGLEATMDLMEGGLRTLEHRRDQLFPNGDAPKGSNFVGPAEAKLMERIKSNIAILKGEKEAESAAPAAVVPPPGKYVFDLATGKMKPAQ